MIKIGSYRVGGVGCRAVVAGLALSALVAAPASAQQNQPFKSVNFAAPVTAAADSAAADPQAPPAAAPANPGYVTFFKSTELGGLVDAYYSWNSNKTPPLFRAFDTTHNAFTVSMAEVWLAKSPDKDSPVGFKVRLNFGPSAKVINFNEPNNDLLNVEEGFVSYMAPVGKGVQLDFGKFVTNAGAEVIEAKDDWNYSRSLLFQNTIPYYHAGVRATYTVNDMVTVMGGIVNGWNNVNENNAAKTVMASITYKPAIPMAPLAIVENYIGGNEKPTGTGTEWRHLSDTVVSYTVNPKVSVLGNVDYTREAFGGVSSHLFGVAGYVKYQATPVVAVIPRVEYLDDPQGLLNAVGKEALKSATVTIELKPADNFMWRIEYRGDFSDQEAFVNDAGSLKKNQQSLIFGLPYSFSTK